MTTESTAPISGQLSAVQVITNLISQFPHLPDAYITIHQPWKGAPSKVDLQLSTPDRFEKWRATLGVKGDSVELHPLGRGSWVEVTTVRDGIHICLSAHGILLTEDQLNAPRHREDVAA